MPTMSEELRACGQLLPNPGPLGALSALRKAAGLQPLWKGAMTRAERACFEVVESRCRVCRDPDVRNQVNGLLDWLWVPVPVEGGKTHKIALSDILRALEPLNEGHDPRDRLTYNSLRVHARRHYEIEGVAAYWEVQMRKKLRKALTADGLKRPVEKL